MKSNANLLLLDIGSRTIRTGILTKDRDNPLVFHTEKEFESSGFLSGEVSNLSAASDCLHQLAESLRSESGIKRFAEIWVGFSGYHFQSENFEEEQPLEVNKSVTRRILKKMDMRVERRVPANHMLMHKVLQKSVLDGTEREDVEGLLGRKLTRSYHMIYCDLPVINNMREVFDQAGLVKPTFFFNGFLAATTVPKSDTTHGYMVLHIGASTCDYMIFQDGFPILGGSINDGWNRIIRDIAIGVLVPLDRAEYLLHHVGSTVDPIVVQDESLPVDTIFGEGSQLTRRNLSKIIGSAAEDILVSIRDKLKQDICRGHLPGGIYLTGGGAVTSGLVYTLEQIFKVRSQMSHPKLAYNQKEYGTDWAPLIGMANMAAQTFNPAESPGNFTDALKGNISKLWRLMFPQPENPLEDPEGEIKL